MASDTVAFQQSFSTKHPEFIQAAQAAANLAEEIFADTNGAALTLPQVVCRALAQTVLNSFYSMTVLAQHGCGVDAQKIVRSMFETSVVLTSFDHFPGLIQDFMDFRWIKKMKAIKEYKGTPKEAYVTPELESEITAQYDLVFPRFLNKKGKPRSSWYCGSFKDLCAALDKDSVQMPWAVVQYADHYSISSGLMHGDIIGLESQADSSGYNVVRPPSDEYITESLMSGHWALWWALASYASLAGLAKAQDYGNQLAKGFSDVWGDGSRELDEAKKALAATSSSKVK